MLRTILFVGLVLAACLFTAQALAGSMTRVKEPEYMWVNAKLMAEYVSDEDDLMTMDDDSRQEMLCIALNIYQEARGSSRRDQQMVGNVVLNRMTLTGQTACEVIWAPHQFSWTHDGKNDMPHDPKAWDRAKIISYNLWLGLTPNETGGRTHYYAVGSKVPKWAKYGHSKKRVGQHIFMLV